MDDDGFFGFDTSLPMVRKGPQQEFGDVELEDSYDALNDETFGAVNIEDDWEEEHEKLAELLVEQCKTDDKNSVGLFSVGDEHSYSRSQPRYLQQDANESFEFEGDNEDASNVAAIVSQFLDDDDIGPSIGKCGSYTKSSSAALGHIPVLTSVFESDLVGSPSIPSIWSSHPSELRASVQTPPKIPTSNVTNLSNGNLPMSLDTHSLLQKGMFKTVEELERDLLLSPKPLTMEELERNILTRVPTTAIRSVEEFEAELTRTTPQKTPNLIPQQHCLGSPFPGVAPPLGLQAPPPMGVNLPPPLPNISVPPMGMHINGPLRPPPPLVQWQARIPANIPHATFAANAGSGPRGADKYGQDEDYDEYAGLMTTKEKQWLLSIQINQLISDNPYVDDYYFTVLRLRRLGTLQGLEGKEGPKLILPERAKPETRTYAPTQFANSLGKLQVVTYTAPRRIIDVNIAHPASDTGVDPQIAVKDLRKFKQILLDIENLYIWLLELEDAEKRVEALPDDTLRFPHYQAAADYQLKLKSALSTGDRLVQIMMVRKGKALILRAIPRLPKEFIDLVFRALMSNFMVFIRRDVNDQMLFRFIPFFVDYLSTADMEAITAIIMTLENAQKSGGLLSAVSTKVGLSIISLLLKRGSDLYPSCSDDLIGRSWSGCVRNIYDALMNCSEIPLSNLTSSRLTLHSFEQIGLGDGQLSALAKILERVNNENTIT